MIYLWPNDATRSFFLEMWLKFCVKFLHAFLLEARRAYTNERQESRWIPSIFRRCFSHSHEETSDLHVLAVVTTEYYQIHVADEIVRVLKGILIILMN